MEQDTLPETNAEIFQSGKPEHMQMLKEYLFERGVLPSNVALATETKLWLEGQTFTDLRSVVNTHLINRGWAGPATAGAQRPEEQEAQALEPIAPSGPATRPGSLAVRRGKKKRGWVATIYGQPKVGKSSLAAHAPGALFADVEGGIDNLDCASVAVPTWDRMISLVHDFGRDAEFQTLVIDTADVLEKKLWEHLCKANKYKSIGAPAYGKGYDEALHEWTRFISLVKGITDTSGKNVLFLAHSNVKPVLSPDSETYDRHGINLHKNIQEHFFGQMDANFFMHFDLGVRKNAQGDFVASSSGQRMLTVGESATCLCGNRFGLSGTIPVDPQIFAAMRFG